MPSLNLFSPPKVTIKRRRYVYADDDDDHDDDNETAAPIAMATGLVRDTSTNNYNDDDCPHNRPMKRQRRCITTVPSFNNLSLFLPILEDLDHATTTHTHQEGGGSPLPSLLPLANRQEERREAEGGRVSPSIHFDETTPFLQPKMTMIRLQQQQLNS